MSYARRQSKWLSIHSLKEGDKCKVICSTEYDEDRWPNDWIPPMDRSIGKIGTIVSIWSSGIQLSFTAGGAKIHMYPFFVLLPLSDYRECPHMNGAPMQPECETCVSPTDSKLVKCWREWTGELE